MQDRETRKSFLKKGASVVIKAAVFDLGGVLIQDLWENLLLNEKRGIVARYHLNRNRVEDAGKLLWEEFAHIAANEERGWQTLEKQYWNKFIQYFREELPANISPEVFIEMTDGFIEPVEGMTSIIEKLKSKGLGLAICSNNSEFWFRRQANKLDLYRFFSPGKIILSCRIGVSKLSPNCEMFRAVTDALGLDDASCLFIDDNRINIERARQCGIKGVLFVGAQQLSSVLCDMGLE